MAAKPGRGRRRLAMAMLAQIDIRFRAMNHAGQSGFRMTNQPNKSHHFAFHRFCCGHAILVILVVTELGLASVPQSLELEIMCEVWSQS